MESYMINLKLRVSFLTWLLACGHAKLCVESHTALTAVTFFFYYYY